MTPHKIANIEVIAVGLPRSGTRSMHQALQLLGYHSLHQPAGPGDSWVVEWPHDRYLYPHHLWRAIGPEATAIVEATCWRLLLLAWPNAKVILTWRDMNAWYASIARHIDSIHSREHHPRASQIYAADRCHEALFGSAYPQRALYTERAHSHRLAVLMFCQLHDREFLEFDCTAGEWGALPEFLGRPAPDQPFPHENRSQTLPQPEHPEATDVPLS